MKKCRRVEKVVFGAGLFAVLLSFIPYLVLGTDSVIPYHDQLDGEILAYLLRAKHLFSGENIIPEFLGGAAKTALTPPAPLAVLLFCVLKPFTAYLFLQFTGQITAYIGMYLLTGQVTKKPLIAALCALLFAFLPFRPVYGLSQFGLPLLFLSIYNLYKNKHTAASLVYIGIYAGMSSLVLCGFGVISVWGILLLVLFFRKKLKGCGRLVLGFFLMTAVYVLENFDLILQISGIAGSYTSHKAEYVISGGSFFSYFLNSFLYNGQYSEDYHVGILIACGVTLIFGFLTYKHRSAGERKKQRLMGTLLGILLLLCIPGALWQWEPVAGLRSLMGSLGAFQVERFLWLAPAVWYLLFACVLDFWLDRELLQVQEKGGLYKRLRLLGAAGLLVICGITGVQIMKSSFLKPCVQALTDTLRGAVSIGGLAMPRRGISWEDYYADGVMEQVESYIRDTTGMEQEEYRVASLGIDPAAALYHGFYTVDGYSNNYSLEYKHQFRETIAPELERSPYLQNYYDNWGNRCYLFSSETPAYYTIEKGTFWYQDLQIDTEALSALSCRYILSAAYIVNSEEMGLTLLSEEPFETDTSYYRIFLYEICR